MIPEMPSSDQPEADLPPLDSLDAAFTLPDTVEDPAMRQLYEVIVARLRAESAHVPMNTVQELLLERIANNYVVLRTREAAAPGTAGGFLNASSQKDFNTFWLEMTKEFNKQVRSVPQGEKEELIKSISTILKRVIRSVGLNEEQSLNIRQQLAMELERTGL